MLIVVIRHAEAIEDPKYFLDFERPLSLKGHVQVCNLAARLNLLKLNPDSIICSAAVRTYSTTQVLMNRLKWDTKKLTVSHSLYNANSKILDACIADLNSETNCVVLVAHNPGVSNFVANCLDDESIGMSPCDCYIIEVDQSNFKKAKLVAEILNN